MFCTHCGAKIADDSRFCPTCGAQQPQASQKKSRSGGSGPSGNAVRIAAIVAVALVAVAIIGGVTMVLTSSGSSGEDAIESSSETEVAASAEDSASSASSAQAADEAAEEEEHYFENDYYYVDLPDDWDDYSYSYTVESDGTVLFYVAKGEDYYGGAYVYVLDASDDAPEASTKLGTSNGKVVYMMNVSAGFFADEYVSDNAQITLK